MSMIRRLCSQFAASASVFLYALLPTQSHAQQQGLPIIPLTAGIHSIQAEVASTDHTRRQGLMQRSKLPRNHGMLFVFDAPERQCFWMRNTPLPLSIAFLADDGGVVNTADMTPLSDEAHCSKQPVRYALEMEQGWFAAHGFGEGSKIGGLPALAK